MNQLSKAHIGFVLAPGFRAADVVGLQAVLGFHPRNQSHYVARSLEPVRGTPGLGLHPTTTFRDCPKLDVLVVGELSEDACQDPELLAFLADQAARARFVIGVSSGVLALARAGVLDGLRVTADQASLAALEGGAAELVDARRVVVDGKLFTAGPSTGGLEAAFMVLRELRGDRVAKLAELSLEYDPSEQYPVAPGEAPPSPEAARELLAATPPLRVAVLCPPRLYAPDIIGAVDVLGRLPQAEIHYVWKRPGPIPSILGPTLEADTALDACPPADVLIVGATMPDCCSDPDVLDFMRRQAEGASAILGVCAGVLVLGAAGLLDAKVATTNFHMLGLLPRVGARSCDREVVSDGRLYTAGPAIGSYEVALMAVRELCGEASARAIEQGLLEYGPNPVFGVGTPERAGPWLTAVSRASLAPALPFYARSVRRGLGHAASPLRPAPSA